MIKLLDFFIVYQKEIKISLDNKEFQKIVDIEKKSKTK